MEVVFLFGAGLSKPADIPLVDELTEQVMTGKEIHRHTERKIPFCSFHR